MREGGVLELELPTPEDFVFERCIVQFELLFQKPANARALTPDADSRDQMLGGLRMVARHMFRSANLSPLKRRNFFIALFGSLITVSSLLSMDAQLEALYIC